MIVLGLLVLDLTLYAAVKYLERKLLVEEGVRSLVESRFLVLYNQLQDLTAHEPDEAWITSVLNVEDAEELFHEPGDVIHCNGYEVECFTEHGRTLLAQIHRKAIESGVYNEKNLEEGGWLDIQVDILRQRGHSRTRAEDLVYKSWQEGRGTPLSLYL